MFILVLQRFRSGRLGVRGALRYLESRYARCDASHFTQYLQVAWEKTLL